MIRKGYEWLDDKISLRPLFANEKQFSVHRFDGTPYAGRNTTSYSNTFVTVRPKLHGLPRYYGSVMTEDGVLIAISDDVDTRYYWFGKRKQGTFLTNKTTRNTEEFWDNLFAGLVVDERLVQIALYNTIGKFFIEAFEQQGHHEKTFAVTGKWKDTSFSAKLSWHSNRPGAITVAASHDNIQQRTLLLSAHVFDALWKGLHPKKGVVCDYFRPTKIGKHGYK